MLQIMSNPSEKNYFPSVSVGTVEGRICYCIFRNVCLASLVLREAAGLYPTGDLNIPV